MTRPTAGGRAVDRRALLRLGATGIVAAAAGRLLGGSEPATGTPLAAAAPAGVNVQRRLVATDGFIRLPGRDKPLLIFGFRQVPFNATVANLVTNFKGKAQTPGPIFALNRDDNFYLSLTNVGFVTRPDLPDSHTVHWHGLPNAVSYFDGSPEMSVAVPPRRNLPYYYRARDTGTYMYHCHFEDVEHVQLGMVGVVYVRAAARQAYGASTAFQREFTLLLNEIDTRPHDLLQQVQEFQWVQYDPNYWTINGRCYPDTVKPAGDPSLPSQPISSLVQCNPGNRVLLRFANLGYEQHAMQLPGIPMTVVAEDAKLLRGPGGADLSYATATVAVSPGQSRDVLFTAPAFDPGRVAGTDPVRGPYNTYLLRNRSHRTLTNGTAAGLGGMATEVRVYANALPVQTAANQTF
jgi:FtsP/CotA-like multicopper oxidase with cupredoxin domain